MTDVVKNQELDNPGQTQIVASDKARENFARLEALRQADRDARIKAETEAAMLRELMESKQKAPEEDPLDGVEEYIDKNRLQLVRQKDRAAMQREAEEIAIRTYESKKREEDKKNYLGKLRGQFSDYDQVMNQSNLDALEKRSPSFLSHVLKIEDDYDRRLLTYEYLKAQGVSQPKEEESIKARVEENQRNPFYIQPGSGTPAAVEFDIKSKAAREQAYAKLKAAQRKPLGHGTGGH